MSDADVLILGAGLAGLTAGRALTAAGRSVILLDKGRRPGGRAAERASPHGPFAHGLPWMREDAPEEWVGWRGVRVPPEGIGAWVDGLADGLDVRNAVTATEVERSGGWAVRCDGPAGPMELTATDLICTLPPPQAVRLFPEAADALAAAHMAPGWTLLAAFDGGTGLDPAQAAGGDRLIPEHLRPGARGPERWTWQIGPEASRTILEMEREEAATVLLGQLGALAGRTLPEPTYLRAHRWRYSHPARPVGAPFVEVGGAILAGDWCLARGREDAAASAIRSGRAAAGALGVPSGGAGG